MTASQPTVQHPARTTRCWTVGSGGRSVDVEVTAADTALLLDVLPGLAGVLGRESLDVWSGSTRLPADLPLTAAELRHGAVLAVGGPGPREQEPARSSALALDVVGGPDAGRTVPLAPGEHLIGRGGRAEVSLDDPVVSRRHALLRVAGARITVADLGSSNGTWLNGQRLEGEARSWSAGAVLRIGTTSMALTGPGQCPAVLERGTGGRMVVRRAPRLARPHSPLEIAFPSTPSPPPPRPLAWVAVVLPAVAGLLMAWLLHTPAFLFFALLSPVVAIATWLSDRWSGRRNGRRAAAAHRKARHEAEQRLTEALDAYRRAAAWTHPDLATLLAAARRASTVLWSRRRDDSDALAVRIGMSREETPITRLREDGTRLRERADDLPTVVDLRATGGLGVVGPRAVTMSILAALIGQLVSLHAPGEVDLLLLTDHDRIADWTWARWLPHLRARTATDGDEELDKAVTALLTNRDERRSDWLVVVVDTALQPRLASLLKEARDRRVLILSTARSPEALPLGADAALVVGGDLGERAILRRSGQPDQGPIMVDRLQPDRAALLARALAAWTPGTSGSGVPDQVRLLDLVQPAPGRAPRDDVRPAWSRTRTSLLATLGQGAQGPARVDLCRDGPHALVAGTTGSGKSELLQTLIGSLALRHPPDRCSFLLVDYKGGAAFAEAASLPHTVGMLTDLDVQTTARALRSLTAELSRREAVLAAHQVAELALLPEEVPLARLVIVVDEFATLAEELPGFVPGLVDIAQRGRSLGVHLVLATQRPSGVVSPEIRANCSLRICLRTTDEAESRDVLGTSDAGRLPIDLPGRAYLRAGSAPPVELQVARVTTAEQGESTPEVRPWTWPPAPQRARKNSAGQPRRPDTDLVRLTGALRRLADEQGLAAPHRPWRPALPDRVAAGDLGEPLLRCHDGEGDGDEARSALRIPLAVVDRPERQAHELLDLDLAEGGVWLALGGPRSGRSTLLRTVLAGTVAAATPDQVHVHVLDHGGGSVARLAQGFPHSGTCVGSDDPLRTVRLIDRLGLEVAARRAEPADAPLPLLLILVDGMEALMSQLDECEATRGSAGLLRLLRDGAAVGMTCVVTADRAVPGGRLAAVARQRLVLPLPDRADYAVAGIPSAAVPTHRPPGRALLGEEGRECQLLLPSPVAGQPVSAAWVPRAGGALRIVELAPDPVLAHSASASVDSSPDSALLVTVGPGGDEGRPLQLDLRRSGGLLIAGPPGSGRSSALAALAAELTCSGIPVAELAWGRRAADAGSRAVRLAPDDRSGLADWLNSLDVHGGALVVDDVGAPADWPALVALALGSQRAKVVLLASGTAGDLSLHFQGPVAGLRRSRTGLLLCPAQGEADLVGIRLPRAPVPRRPGSGWLATAGTLERVQVARRRIIGSADAPPAAGPLDLSGRSGERLAHGRRHSSSSTAPISCVAYHANS